MIMTFVACEVKSDKPLYQVIDLYESPTNSNAITPSASSDSNELATSSSNDTVSLEEIKSRYFHEPTVEKTVIGEKIEYIKLDDDKAEKVKLFVDSMVNDLYNLSYARENEKYLEHAYSNMTQELSDKIRESGYYDTLFADINKYSFITSIPMASIMEGNYACRISLNDGREALRVRAELVLSTVADDKREFYEIQDHYVYGDSVVEIWLYIIDGEDDQYVLVGWDEFFSNPDRLYLFYEGIVTEKKVRNECSVNVFEGFESSVTVSFTKDEKDNLISMRDQFMSEFFVFDAMQNDTITDISMLTDEAKQTYKAQIDQLNRSITDSDNKMRIRNIKSRELESNNTAQRVKKNTTDQLSYILLQVNFYGKLDKDMENTFGLLSGIRSYKLFIVFKQDGNDFFVDSWTLRESGEGELDIDFEAASMDQG
jgi:hypothetical protein